MLMFIQPQDKGLDTQGEFSRWWQSNLDPEANAASVKGMKVCAPSGPGGGKGDAVVQGGGARR